MIFLGEIDEKNTGMLRRVGGRTRLTERGKGDVGGRQERGYKGAEEESIDPSCMIGVSGRFLCDIQVEAWPQQSTDAAQMLYVKHVQ